MDLYIAPNGNDKWTGRRRQPNGDKTDGPFASFHGALQAIRRLKQSAALDGPLTVHVRGGVYPVSAPIVLRPEDSWPVTFKAYGDEKPVISGGERITGWRTETINGRRTWVADLPEVREGQWHFRQLFVNGRRAPRPRLPGKGLYRMAAVPGLSLPTGWCEDAQTRFVCAPGDVKAFANLTDVEVVYLHFWIEERSPIASFDAATNRVTMTRPSRTAMVGSHGSQLADYYLDNVFEALHEPGSWYLDRPKGRLYYLPRPGETPRHTVVIAPRALQLLALLGTPEKAEYVEFIRFEGIAFAHTDWRHPREDGASLVGPSDGTRDGSFSRRHNRGPRAAASQAASDIPGVISMSGARACSLVDCSVEHIGWYGIEIGDACHGIRIEGNTIRDMGAGGVRINGGAARDPDVSLMRTGHHLITDNVIAEGGRVFHSAVGVLSMHAFRVTIAHNHIYDLFYSGVSCGWEWGYQESVSRDNRIEYNHIHDIGQGLLSDMGGIYTLGVQPGTVIRNNLIHDVRCAHYGGWCIYPDEGSSHILIENNVCYRADRNAFHQHYGRENIVLNNVFAFGNHAVATYSRAESHMGFTMQRNILLSDGGPIFASGYAYRLAKPRHRSDLNLLYDLSGKRPTFIDTGDKKRSLGEWRGMGYDRHSVVADPRFRNPRKGDFTLAKDSPALRIGFVPIDLSRVGPRPKSKRA